jgi:hypothetical protein
MIALSTLESEYISLSQSMRELLPLKELLQEFCSEFGMTDLYKVSTHSTVFEDNQGCVSLCKTGKLTPRNKHIAAPYHFWRSHVMAGVTTVQWVDTKNQTADLLTKNLPEEAFLKHRKTLMGW